MMKKSMVVLLFSCAMGALESAVVVYLRALYYPGVFTVSLRVTDPLILRVEILREFATIVMLAMIGFLAGSNLRQRFAWFLIAFAIWDITYYGWLLLFIGWPQSLMDWDILFLFPVTWLGPVLAPIICSVTMISFGILLLKLDRIRSSFMDKCLMLSGCVLILYSFMNDYLNILTSAHLWLSYFTLLSSQAFIKIAATYQPECFEWGIFAAGEIFIAIAVTNMTFRAVRLNKSF